MPRIYVACLASYNNGVMHGAWIDASSDVDEMQTEINKILRSSKFPNVTVNATLGYDAANRPIIGPVASAEEYAIHDHEGFESFKPDEGQSLKSIARLCDIIERAETEFHDDGAGIVAAYWDHMGQDYMPDDASDAVEQARDAYAGHFENQGDWAENFLEETGGLQGVPEHLKNYIDFNAYGRDALYGGDMWCTGQNGRGHWFRKR